MKPEPKARDLQPEIIAIDASLGGAEALSLLLPVLPRDYPFPVVVVLHRHRDSGDTLAKGLQKSCSMPVLEAEDKMPVEPGRVYLAPADYHLLIERGAGNSEFGTIHFALSTEEEVNHARPSIDALFESAAEAYGRGVVGAILTGAGEDGAGGLARIKKLGGLTVVQEPKRAEAPDMPKAAIAATQVDFILPVEEIGAVLVKLAQT